MENCEKICLTNGQCSGDDSRSSSRDDERSNKLNRQYDTRATPRRRAKTESSDEQPIFLRKAFSMISACPNVIGGI